MAIDKAISLFGDESELSKNFVKLSPDFKILERKSLLLNSVKQFNSLLL